jgi:O-antigen/teichoic acid export membrane protein
LAFFNTIIDYSTVIFGSIFGRGFAFLNSLIIARLLGPEEFGVFSIFFAVMILTWQLPQAFDGVFVTFSQKYDDVEKKNDLLKTAILLKVLYFTTVAILAFPIASILAQYFFMKNALVIPVFLALICGIFLMFLMTVASTFQADMKFGRFAFTNAAYTFTIFLIIVGYFFLKSNLSLYFVMFTYLLVAVVIGSVCFIVLSRRVKKIFDVDRVVLKEVFSQGKWVFLVVGISCVFSRLDLLFLPIFVSYADIGIYAVAIQLILIVDMASGALAGICLPKAGAAVRSKTAFKKFFRESVFIIFLIESGILVLFLIAPYIVSVAYGQQYAYSGTILRYLLYGWVFNVIMVPFSFLYTALEDSRSRFFLELSKLAIGIGMLYILIPKFGLIGGACAVSATLTLNSIMSAWVLKRRLFLKNKGHFVLSHD